MPAKKLKTQPMPPPRTHKNPLDNPGVRDHIAKNPQNFSPTLAADALHRKQVLLELANPIAPIKKDIFRNRTIEVQLTKLDLKATKQLPERLAKLGEWMAEKAQQITTNPLTTPAHKRLDIAKLADESGRRAENALDDAQSNLIESSSKLATWYDGLLEAPLNTVDVSEERELRDRLLAMEDSERFNAMWGNARALKAALRDPLGALTKPGDFGRLRDRLAELDNPENASQMKQIEAAEDALSTLRSQVKEQVAIYNGSAEVQHLRTLEQGLQFSD